MSEPARVYATEHRIEVASEAARNLLATLDDVVGDDDDFRSDLVEGETNLGEVIDMAIREIRECDVIEAGCKAEIETLSKRAGRVKARRDKLRACIEQALLMADLQKLSTPTKTLSLAHRKGAVVVEDEAKIPSRFFVPQPPKLDKSALKEALESGPVEGARMSNGTVSLTIRSK